MKRPLFDSLRVAFATLTALPVNTSWSQQTARDAVGWYPFVGLALGLLAAALDAALVSAGALRAGTLGIAALTVAIWAMLTRMLHWDGLADVGDAYFAADAGKRLAIMRDSSVGAFGATSVALVLAIQVPSLAALIGRSAFLPLAAVPVFGRLGACFGAWFGKPARADGLGASVAGARGLGGFLAAAVTVALVVGVLVWTNPVPGVVVAGAGIFMAAAVPHLLARRFGGVTGDVLGASILLTEALVAFVAAWVW